MQYNEGSLLGRPDLTGPNQAFALVCVNEG